MQERCFRMDAQPGNCNQGWGRQGHRMAGSQTDITEGKVADPLTGLPNRLYLIDKVETAIEGAVKEKRL